MITIYSKDNCPWCERAKDYMNVKDEPYTEIKIGRDITREEFMEQYPNVRSVPYFRIGQVEFTSYEELKKHIDNPVRQKLSSL